MFNIYCLYIIAYIVVCMYVVHVMNVFICPLTHNGYNGAMNLIIFYYILFGDRHWYYIKN